MIKMIFYNLLILAISLSILIFYQRRDSYNLIFKENMLSDPSCIWGNNEAHEDWGKVKVSIWILM